jgi:hypothetical protein
MEDRQEVTWEEFTKENPTFPSSCHKAFKMLPQLVLDAQAQESDRAGMVIDQIILALLPDFNDILLLSSHNAHWGALKLLRCAFERVATLKYIAQNPSEVEAFIDFDSLDWKRILMGIENKTGLRMSETSQKNLDTAVATIRKRFRQEPCETCGLRKQTTWTPLSARDLAKRTGMEHMFFHAYELASKFIHPTFWGTNQITRGADVYNTLKNTHELLLHTMLVHHKYFRDGQRLPEQMVGVIEDFFSIWKFAETDFGFPEYVARYAR